MDFLWPEISCCEASLKSIMNSPRTLPFSSKLQHWLHLDEGMKSWLTRDLLGPLEAFNSFLVSWIKTSSKEETWHPQVGNCLGLEKPSQGCRDGLPLQLGVAMTSMISSVWLQEDATTSNVLLVILYPEWHGDTRRSEIVCSCKYFRLSSASLWVIIKLCFNLQK